MSGRDLDVEAAGSAICIPIFPLRVGIEHAALFIDRQVQLPGRRGAAQRRRLPGRPGPALLRSCLSATYEVTRVRPDLAS